MVLAVGQWVILGDKFSAAAETPSCGNISKLLTTFSPATPRRFLSFPQPQDETSKGR
jgi:hypothetical protein